MSHGLLEMTWGDGAVSPGQTASAAVPFTPGQTGWVRATLDVDNGAGGYEVKFYSSTDGVTWTQIGVTRTGVGTTVGDSADALEIGTGFVGAGHLEGLIHYAEVRNGIDGTVVAVFDPNRVRVTGPNAPTTIPSTSGVWTISGNGWAYEEVSA
jgi:hypothetical protein